MTIQTVRLLPYRLPLRRPWISAKGSFSERRGWHVRLATQRCIGWGDCAPLPEAGTERDEDAEAWLTDHLRGLVGQTVTTALAMLPPPDRAPPAARCAVEMALLDLAAQEDGLPLARLLDPQAPLVISVNAAIGALDRTIAGRARAAIAEGYTLLKVKVGCGDPLDEVEGLKHLAARLPPGVNLRLDANQAWTAGQTRAFLASIEALPVESLEEPVRDSDAHLLADLQRQTRIPLVLDESLPAFLRTDPSLTAFPVHRLILKPMVLGGLRPALALARNARRHGIGCVVTSVIESAVGIRAGAHLAAAVAPHTPHGLATCNRFVSRRGCPVVENATLRLVKVGVPGPAH